MQVHQIVVGAFVGALAAYAVKGLVDLLFHYFGPRTAPDDDALADAARREIERVRARQRERAYREFDERLQAAVDDISRGWNRMSTIYAARDRFIALGRLAPPTVLKPARVMCDACAAMLQKGYDETLHNRFQRAQAEFHAACRSDLSPPDPASREEPPDPERRAPGGRKYYSPHD
ncbi:MAG: hypothetical protein ACE5G3_01630 [Gammaproteobacteria bacterium]